MYEDFLDPNLFSPLGTDKEALKRGIRDHLIRSIGADPQTASPRDWLNAISLTTRDRLLECWVHDRRHYTRTNAKRVFYLSMEFLIGRLLINALLNTGLYEAAQEALADFGLELAEIAEYEPDAALGNGGLGRLAACILDSLATLGLPGYGYGIRYDYGMFRQEIRNGCQVEHPDDWLRYGNSWEVARPERMHEVCFYGHLASHICTDGSTQYYWEDSLSVYALRYDYAIPG